MTLRPANGRLGGAAPPGLCCFNFFLPGRVSMCRVSELSSPREGSSSAPSSLLPSQTGEKPQVRPARGPGLREPLSPQPPVPQGRWVAGKEKEEEIEEEVLRAP